jgi:hypothetical protein
MFRLFTGFTALTAIVVALAVSVPVNGQDKKGVPAVDKGGAVKGAVDVEALFRKYASKDGKLTLAAFKQLLGDLDGQAIVIGGPAKVGDPRLQVIKGGGNK